MYIYAVYRYSININTNIIILSSDTDTDGQIHCKHLSIILIIIPQFRIPVNVCQGVP